MFSQVFWSDINFGWTFLDIGQTMSDVRPLFQALVLVLDLSEFQKRLASNFTLLKLYFTFKIKNMVIFVTQQ